MYYCNTQVNVCPVVILDLSTVLILILTLLLDTINTHIVGFIDASAVKELLSECAKMKNFDNLHVMSLKGVCLDGGPVPYIVLPYMANGSLASYLKKERKNLVLMKDNDNTSNVAIDSEDSIQSQVSFFISCGHIDSSLSTKSEDEH